MLFNEFSNLVFSLPSPVILLEGSRSVEDADREKLTALGAKLASAFPNIVFRSGNADGADSLFAEGILQVNPKQLELILPNDRKLKSTHGERRISLEQLDKTELNQTCQLTKKATPINKPLIEFYEQGKQGNPRFKAQYLLRDALKVIGSEKLNFKPAAFGLFYLNSKRKQAAAQVTQLEFVNCKMFPVVMQSDWLNW